MKGCYTVSSNLPLANQSSDGKFLTVSQLQSLLHLKHLSRLHSDIVGLFLTVSFFAPVCVLIFVCYCYVQNCHHNQPHSRLARHASRLVMLQRQLHLLVPAQAHRHRPLRDHLSVHHPVILCLPVFKPLLSMTLKEMRLSVTLYSELARQLQTSAMYLQSGCRDASVTGRAIFRRLLSRFLDLKLRETLAFVCLLSQRIIYCSVRECLICDYSNKTIKCRVYCEVLISLHLICTLAFCSIGIHFYVFIYVW